MYGQIVSKNIFNSSIFRDAVGLRISFDVA